MTSINSDMADNFIPPKEGQTLVLEVNTSSVRWNLHSVNIGSALLSSRAPTSTSDFYLTIQAQGANVFVAISNNSSAAISESNVVAASSAPNITNDANACVMIVDGQDKSWKLNRKDDKWLVLKGAAAAKARIYLSSHPNPDERKG